MAKARRSRIGGKVKIGELDNAVRAILEEFDGYVSTVVVRDAIDKTAEETVEAIKADAPNRTGAYMKSITHKPITTKKRGIYSQTIYEEAPGFRLAHLLERSHVTKNGKRTKEYPHWSTGESGIFDRLIKNLREML